MAYRKNNMINLKKWEIIIACKFPGRSGVCTMKMKYTNQFHDSVCKKIY